MVFCRVYCSPEDREALVAVTLRTSSPTLSLSAEDPANPFQLIISLRIASSKRPGRAITICTNGTVFEYHPRPFEGLDMLARGAFSSGLLHSSNPDRNINFGYFFINVRSSAEDPDLRKRERMQFITIPGDGSETQIAHDLPFSRMFKYEERMKKEDLKPGDTYKVAMRPGYIATPWWCWGDLEGDLQDKKFSGWQEGWEYNYVTRPSDEEVEKEGWVFGGHPDKLVFEDRTEGRYAEFQIAE